MKYKWIPSFSNLSSKYQKHVYQFLSFPKFVKKLHRTPNFYYDTCRVLTYLMNIQLSFLKHSLEASFKIFGNLVIIHQFLKKDIKDHNVTADLLVNFLLSVKYFKSYGLIFICCVVLQKSAVLSSLLNI